MVLSFGVGAMNCLLIGLVPLWQRPWGTGMRSMFLVSGVFFTFEAVPLPWRDLLWWNPLVHVVGEIRCELYPGYDAVYVSRSYVVLLGALLALMAGIGLRRWYRSILSDL